MDTLELAAQTPDTAGEDAVRDHVLRVITAETAAYQRKDYAALASHWLQSPQSHRMESTLACGVVVNRGWDEINARFLEVMQPFAEGAVPANPVWRDNFAVRINRATAWVTYDQHGEDTGDSFDMPGLMRELKILHKVAGRWLLACVVVMQGSSDRIRYPAIELAEDLRVLWMNDAARSGIADHPGLIITGGRLRARQHAYSGGLTKAVQRIFEFGKITPHTCEATPPPAVILGTDDFGRILLCWVMRIDDRVMISFDNDQMVERRLATAGDVFGLSPTQTQIASRLAAGDSLANVADALEISVNTARTHLARMFDKTGAHSQVALLSLLLSVTPPRA